MTDSDFLGRLEAEAQLQAKINHERWLPPQLDPLMTLIAQYAWQTLAVAAVVTSLLAHWATK